jgi:glutamine synthetase
LASSCLPVSIIEGRPSPSAPTGEMMRLGVNALPPLPRDIADRNRTSPFAFTGNKFEFRAVGSRHSLAYPSMVLNTIVAESLDFIATELEHRSGSGDRREAIQGLVRQMLAEHQRILFSGDNYSAEWVQEAERRGLANLRDTPSALTAFIKPSSVGTLGRYGVLNQRETEARYEVLTSKYAHRIAVEARAMCDLASTTVLPAAISFQKQLADSIAAVAAVQTAPGVAGKIDTGPQIELLKTTAHEINELKLKTDSLRATHDEAESNERTSAELANYFRDQVVPALNEVRHHIDRLETLVEDDLWPFPKYREMLFVQ